LEDPGKLQAQAAQVYKEQMKKGKLSTNRVQNKIINRAARRVIDQAKRLYGDLCSDFNWEVNILESKDANAFAMPGGKIAVYTGILPVCENEAALAAVLGHEVAHALLSHGNERMSQAKLTSAGLAVAQAVTHSTVEDDTTKKIAMTALGLGAQFGVLLPYSRLHESEADTMGLRISAAAGYDPAEAPKLWKRMKEKSGGAPMEFMSTHPSHDRRINDLKQMQKEVAPIYASSPKYGLGSRL
jgi:predicted Zn-dependent protease